MIDSFRHVKIESTHIMIQQNGDILNQIKKLHGSISKLVLPIYSTQIPKIPLPKVEIQDVKKYDLSADQKISEVFKNIDFVKLSNSKGKTLRGGFKYSGSEVTSIKQQLQAIEREKDPRSELFKSHKKSDMIDEIISFYNYWKNKKE